MAAAGLSTAAQSELIHAAAHMSPEWRREEIRSVYARVPTIH